MKHFFTICLALLLLISAQPGNAQRKSIKAAPSNTAGKAVNPVDPPYEPEPVYEGKCYTPDPSEQEMQDLPWYADTLYLQHFYDSLATARNNSSASRGVEDVWMRIPIQFWVYTNGTAADLAQLPDDMAYQRMMDNVNNAFRTNGIQARFYMLCPIVVNEPSSVTINNDTEMTQVTLNHKTPLAVNVHIALNVGGVYNPFTDAIFIPRRVYNPDMLRINTLAHEIGHYFGLQHTFLFSKVPCFREPVARGWVPRPFCPQNLYPKTCAVTGDLLTDTEADHEDLEADDAICAYTGTQEDFWGKRFRPNARNYMTYLSNVCRSQFSQQQRAVILRNMFVKRASEAWAGSWPIQSVPRQFDDFEPDNTLATSRLMTIGESLVHSIHNVGCGDPEDWMRVFGSATPSSYIIEIDDVSGYTNPANAVTVHDATGATLATSVLSNVGTKRRLLLPCSSLGAPGFLFFIRVTGLPNVVGRYRISLVQHDPQVSGPAFMCPFDAKPFQVAPLFPGASVEWRVEPANSGLILSPLTGATTTASTSGTNGTYTIIARITDNGCVFERQQQVVVSPGQVNITIEQQPYNMCQGAQFLLRAEVSPANPAAVYSWTATNGATVAPNGSGLVQVQSPYANGFFDVTVTTPNPCGGPALSTTIPLYVYTDPSTGECANPYRSQPTVTTYPNPSHAGFTLTVVDGFSAKARASASSATSYTLYDYQGVRVASGTTAKSTWVDTHHLKAGLYNLVIQAADGQVTRRQIQVTHE